MHVALGAGTGGPMLAVGSIAGVTFTGIRRHRSSLLFFLLQVSWRSWVAKDVGSRRSETHTKTYYEGFKAFRLITPLIAASSPKPKTKERSCLTLLDSRSLQALGRHVAFSWPQDTIAFRIPIQRSFWKPK